MRKKNAIAWCYIERRRWCWYWCVVFVVVVCFGIVVVEPRLVHLKSACEFLVGWSSSFCFCFFVIRYVCRSLAHLGSPASVSSLDKQHKHNRVNACIGTYARAKGMPTHKYTSSHRDGVVRWQFCPLFTRSLSPFVGFCDMRSFSFTRYNTKHTLPTIQFFVNIFFVARSFSLYLCRSFSSYLFLVVVVVAFVVACILNDIMSIFMYLCVLRSRIRFCVLEFQCCAHTNVSMCGWVCVCGGARREFVCVCICMYDFFFLH